VPVRSRLAELAAQDEVVAPLALLQDSLAAEVGDWWDAAVPALDAGRLGDGLPLLHGAILTANAARVAALLSALVGASQREPAMRGAEGGASAGDALGGIEAALERGTLNALALLEASICQDTERLAALADNAGVELEPLAVVGQLLAQPLLRACGQKAAALLEGKPWDAGYCPVCAAWPGLAERRGLERLRFLRCARCAAEWRYYLQRCPYCGNNDPKTLGYLAPEAQREARQAATCDACHGYVKSVATVAALAPDELMAMDLTTLELDVAALEHGYGRPEERGFPLEVRVVDGDR